MSGTKNPLEAKGHQIKKIYSMQWFSILAVHYMYLETFYKMLSVEISSSDQLNSNSWCRGPDINFKSLPGYYNVHWVLMTTALPLDISSIIKTQGYWYKANSKFRYFLIVYTEEC